MCLCGMTASPRMRGPVPPKYAKPHVFAQGRGGKMRLYELLRGQVRTPVQSTRQTRRVWVHARLGNFDFGLLVKSGTVFAQT